MSWWNGLKVLNHDHGDRALEWWTMWIVWTHCCSNPDCYIITSLANYLYKHTFYSIEEALFCSKNDFLSAFFDVKKLFVNRIVSSEGNQRVLMLLHARCKPWLAPARTAFLARFMHFPCVNHVKHNPKWRIMKLNCLQNPSILYNSFTHFGKCVMFSCNGSCAHSLKVRVVIFGWVFHSFSKSKRDAFGT